MHIANAHTVGRNFVKWNMGEADPKSQKQAIEAEVADVLKLAGSGGPTPGPAGIWEAQMMGAMSRSKVVQIGPSWQRLSDSWPLITAGTRAGRDTGPWVGASFDKVFAATCLLTDNGACD